MNYEPPIVAEQDTSESFWSCNCELAPGVLGFAFMRDNEIHIPVVVAVTEGSGDVGRFLDSLSERCVVVSVVSTRLAGMLERRGFKRIPRTKDWRRHEQRRLQPRLRASHQEAVAGRSQQEHYS